jgi:hypothetical protein
VLYTLILPAGIFAIYLYLLVGLKEEKRTRVFLAILLAIMPWSLFLVFLIRWGRKALTLLPYAIVSLALGLIAFYIEFRKGGYQEYKRLFQRRTHND